MSAFTPEQLAYLEAHKNESKVSEIHWAYSVPIVAASISTSLRVWAKRAGRNGVTLDDYIIVFASIVLIGQCCSGLGYGPPHGMGRHINTVSPEDITILRQGDYVFSHFYDIALASVKLGILAFYYRVFAVPLFRKIVLATTLFVFCWGVGITVALAVVCVPIQAYWDDSVTGKCLKMVPFFYFTNISNLCTDIWIFLMPIPVIWHLQLQTKKKLLLCFTFSIGLATCIVSSIRLTVVLGHANPDFTWSIVPLGAYSVFEPLGGILCTNLPIIWHRWRHRKPLLPSSSAFRSKHSSTRQTPGTGSNSRSSRFARRALQSVGISTHDSQPDSQTGAILEREETREVDNRWRQVPHPGSRTDSAFAKDQQPVQFFNRIESRGSNPEETQDVREGNQGGIRVEREIRMEEQQAPPKRQSWGRGMGGFGSKQGLKRNIYEVRKK